MPTPEAEAQTLRDMRARRDEVEQALRDSGWTMEVSGILRRWTKGGASYAYTPDGEPSIDDQPRWAIHLAQAAAIAVKPIASPHSRPDAGRGEAPLSSPAVQDAGGVRATSAKPAPVVEFREVGGRMQVVTPEAVEEFLLTPKAELLPGRRGQQHSAPLPEGLAGLGARGQEPAAPRQPFCYAGDVPVYVGTATTSGPLKFIGPTAPTPTLAEVQAERAEAKAEIDRLTAALDCERVQANEWLARLHDARKAGREACHELKAIAALLDADPERSPAWDDNDQPIPLPRRVEVALMPEGPGNTWIERKIMGHLDAYGVPTERNGLTLTLASRVAMVAQAWRDLRAPCPPGSIVIPPPVWADSGLTLRSMRANVGRETLYAYPDKWEVSGDYGDDESGPAETMEQAQAAAVAAVAEWLGGVVVADHLPDAGKKVNG